MDLQEKLNQRHKARKRKAINNKKKCPFVIPTNKDRSTYDAKDFQNETRQLGKYPR